MVAMSAHGTELPIPNVFNASSSHFDPNRTPTACRPQCLHGTYS